MKSDYPPSIFNDVMGPIMRGPSSSHTAAAHRIGSMIRQSGHSNFTNVIVQFDRVSSLATTYLSQGSALGLAGGLLGLEIVDAEIINYKKHLENSNFNIEYIITDIENKHPNAYQIEVQYPDRDLNILAVSVGGGMFEILEWENFKVSITGSFFEYLMFFKKENAVNITEVEQLLNNDLSNFKLSKSQNANGDLLVDIKSGSSLSSQIETIPGLKKLAYNIIELVPVMPVPSVCEYTLPFNNMVEMLDLALDKNHDLSDIAIMYEMSHTGLDPDTIKEKMEEIVLMVKNSIDEGLKGTHYDDRILGAQSSLINQAQKKGLIQNTINSKIIAYTSAIMEVKSSMGLIVAIPTAGSCGVVGGALFGSLPEDEFDLKKMVRAFLAAGMVGVFIADKYTFSAEEGGCQVETGSGSAMAAAGLVELNGGTAKQALDAASMALQNLLGVVCDPVAVRVEVPCLGKNIMAATNALNSSIMALAGYDPVIPYDETIDAMKEVGEALPASLCCTGLGGLAQTSTGQCLHKKFNKH